MAASYDDDPSDSSTEASFDLAAAWRPMDNQNYQFDAKVDFGLTRNTSDVAVLVGFVRRF